jgi:hypothetical protein
VFKRKRRPEGADPFDVTLPRNYDLGEHRPDLEAAAKKGGWTIEKVERDDVIVVRDVWTDNEDHAAWLVATPAGLSPERVRVWAGREA